MKVRQLIIAAMATFALASCNKEEGGTLSPAESNFPEDGVIRVTTDVSEAVRTRASLTTESLDHFYFSVYGVVSNYNDYFRLMVKDATSGEWAPEGDPMPWEDKFERLAVSAAVFGSYVFSEANLRQTAAPATLTLPTDQSTQETLNSADLLAMKTTYISPQQDLTADGKIPLQLNHALSKLNIQLTCFKAIEAVSDITNFKISGVAKQFSYAVAATAGSELSDVGTKDASITPLAGSKVASDRQFATCQITYEAILIPATYEDFAVSFTFGGKNYSWTGSVTLAQGNEYVLPLDLGDILIHTTAEDPDNLNLVGAWNSGSEGSNNLQGGTMAEQVERVPDGYVDLGVTDANGKKLYWAQSNAYDSKRWDQLTDDEKAEMPTKEDFVALANQCYWEWTGAGYNVFKVHDDADAGKVSSLNSSSYTPEVAYSSDTEKHIFLPAVEGETYNYYWSSIPKNTSEAYCLYFDEYGPQPENTAYADNSRAVRLVKRSN